MTNCPYLMEPKHINFPSPIEEPETSNDYIQEEQHGKREGQHRSKAMVEHVFMQFTMVVSRI